MKNILKMQKISHHAKSNTQIRKEAKVRTLPPRGPSGGLLGLLTPRPTTLGG